MPSFDFAMNSRFGIYAVGEFPGSGYYRGISSKTDLWRYLHRVFPGLSTYQVLDPRVNWPISGDKLYWSADLRTTPTPVPKTIARQQPPVTKGLRQEGGPGERSDPRSPPPYETTANRFSLASTPAQSSPGYPLMYGDRRTRPQGCLPSILANPTNVQPTGRVLLRPDRHPRTVLHRRGASLSNTHTQPPARTIDREREIIEMIVAARAAGGRAVR